MPDPKTGNVELKEGDFYFALNETRAAFPRETEQMTIERLYELLEPKLRTDAQKNAVKEILNSYNTYHMDEFPSIHHTLLDYSGLFVKGSISEKSFFKHLNEHIDEYYKNAGKKPNLKGYQDKTDYMKSAKGYINDVLKELENEASKGKDTSKKEIGLEGLIKNVNKSKARKEDIPLIDLVDEKATFKLRGVDGNPEMAEYTTKRILELCEPKLENNSQKNALRSVLNAYVGDEFYSPADENLLRGIIQNFLGGNAPDAPKQFTANLDNLAKRGLECLRKYNLDSRIPGTNLKETIKYASGTMTEIRNASMPDSVKNTDAPDLGDGREAAWILTLPQKAWDAKGKWRDSSQYKAFYKNVEVIKDIAEKYIDARDKGLSSIPLKNFDKKTREVLTNYVENGSISADSLAAVYKKSWTDLQQSAVAYEKYKLVDKGFTRDPKGHGHRLDQSGRRKFLVMDEVLGRKEREPYILKEAKAKESKVKEDSAKVVL